eukprot:TRINITY_DN9340_c0_g1_i2.p1 TRINITY_DN9340_c0_g1~~TRINITY_DN9340_c0_g1_i2.p1  ORF type:complete len:128 (+),score=20.36 TRINITY_DN9340_c0_g1_i2:748-1131(+)
MQVDRGVFGLEIAGLKASLAEALTWELPAETPPYRCIELTPEKHEALVLILTVSLTGASLFGCLLAFVCQWGVKHILAAKERLSRRMVMPDMERLRRAVDRRFGKRSENIQDPEDVELEPINRSHSS